METITFFSYKGGTGRSLAVAQLAAALAWCGKNVCVLDFDFEAPGLHHKISLLQKTGIPRFDKGSINYIYDFVKKQKEIGSIPVCPECGQDVEGLRESTFGMESVEKKVIPLDFGKPGERKTIHLFPAGDVLAPDLEYWKILTDPSWQRFMSFDPGSRVFFDRLKNKIATELEPKPDYLLIDSRSGMNEFSGICTRALADKVVFFTGNHIEGFIGTNLILHGFEDARDKKALAPKRDATYIVLARIPQYYYDEEWRFTWFSPEALDTAVQEALNHINYKLKQKFSEIFVLRSEPLLLIKERLPIPFTKPTLNSQLSGDYIRFFVELIGDEEFKEEMEHFLPEIRTFRPYLLVEEMGMMINPEDNRANVAFRVDTLNSMFASFFVNVLQREKGQGRSDDEAKEIASTALYEAGKGAARRFSAYLRDTWVKMREEDRRTPDFRSRLDTWCTFDSTVGFGKFEAITWGEGKEGEIRLTNNFLLYERSEKDYNLSAFFTGYISSVLEAIFETSDLEVTHDLDKDCGQYKDVAPKVCVFRFEVGA